jgi:hypothetical protein
VRPLDLGRARGRADAMAMEGQVTRRSVNVAVALMLAAASTTWPGAQALPDVTTGSLCVLPHVERAQAHRSSPMVPPPAEHYSLRLDGGAWVPLSARTAVLLADIPLQGTHKVAIRGDGRPFSAFSFSFAEFDRSDLCLSQNDLYLTWGFHPSPKYSGCRCKGITPAKWAGAGGLPGR